MPRHHGTLLCGCSAACVSIIAIGDWVQVRDEEECGDYIDDDAVLNVEVERRGWVLRLSMAPVGASARSLTVAIPASARVYRDLRHL